MNQLLCKTIEEWRKWLKQNHRKVDEVWLVFYKKGAGEQSLDYDSALDEALCFGWIDSIIKKIDDTKYARKFTPRNEVSKWSEIKQKAGRAFDQRWSDDRGRACRSQGGQGQWLLGQTGSTANCDGGSGRAYRRH